MCIGKKQRLTVTAFCLILGRSMTAEKLFNYYGWTGHHILCSIIKINYNNIEILIIIIVNNSNDNDNVDDNNNSNNNSNNNNSK